MNSISRDDGSGGAEPSRRAKKAAELGRAMPFADPFGADLVRAGDRLAMRRSFGPGGRSRPRGRPASPASGRYRHSAQRDSIALKPRLRPQTRPFVQKRARPAPAATRPVTSAGRGVGVPAAGRPVPPKARIRRQAQQGAPGFRAKGGSGHASEARPATRAAPVSANTRFLIRRYPMPRPNLPRYPESLRRFTIAAAMSY